MLMDRSRLLEELQNRCETLSPMRVLDRGYVIVRKDGNCVRSTETLQTNDQVEILFGNGSADAAILGERKGNGQE